VCGVDRVMFGGEGPLVFEKVFFLRSVVTSVEVALVFSGTYSSLIVLFFKKFKFLVGLVVGVR
jgi:hypothetical protein